jgi:hypothetical protein
VWRDKDENEKPVSLVGPNLRRGSASVMATLPTGLEVGDLALFVARTKDTRNEFENRAEVTIKPWAEHREPGTRPKERTPPDKTPGKDRERPRELATPKIVPVYRDRWEELKFDENTAMKMETEYDGQENAIAVFHINMDNTPLLNEIKLRRLDDMPARNQFMYANVLIGLSILLQDRDKGEVPTDVPHMTTEERIDITCRALAPFMLSLTSLGQEDLSDADQYDGLDAAAG